MTPNEPSLIVLAVGGNSLITDNQHTSCADQYRACLETCRHIVWLLSQGHRVVITHGNGPQVGFLLRRAELASHEVHMVPLDACGAETQGSIGYSLQRAMHNCMIEWPQPRPVATVVTQVVVDEDDPAFHNPTKPIGAFMDAAAAAYRREYDGWHMIEDAGRGFRRVVPSPRPRHIVEIETIRCLVQSGCVVIAAGGGGIPVVRRPDGTLRGSEAVIDKDLASSLLARELGADVLLISTAVEQVFVDFGRPDAKPLASVSAGEVRRLLAEGHFARGSMLPKVEASLEFLENGGKMALITNPPNLRRALAGETGTRIMP